MKSTLKLPRRDIDEVVRLAKIARPYVRGRLAMDTARAWLDRDYSGIPSGLCYMADDFTLPVYWWIPDGSGWYQLVRGQCLILIDFRTLRILGFSLQPDKNYNSLVIHTLLTRAFTDWGVPQILYFEKGIWQSSKLITGGVKAPPVPKNWEFQPSSWPEVSRGFGDLGVQFIHAHRARSKPVERVGGLVQDLMDGEPGYCGRDERHDLPVACKRQMEDVKYHRAHPSKYFYDQAAWNDRLTEIFTKYNGTPQDGKILAGMSPDEAQQKLQDPAKAPLDFDLCRHLLAHYKVEVSVGSRSRNNARSNGITLRFGKREYVYRNEDTGRDKFKRKLAWFNPEEPSILGVTDLNGQNPYSVPLSESVGALDAILDPESPRLAEQMALVNAHEAPGKTMFNTMKAKWSVIRRKLVPNHAMATTGMEMRQQREVLEGEKQEASRIQTNVRRRASELSIPSRALTTSPDSDEGTRMMLEAKRAAARESQPVQE